MQFPKHDASLSLTHNDHLSYYATVSEAIKSNMFGYTEWISEEQKQQAIDTNDCWVLQWYPDSPVGFHVMAAADLPALLEAANRTKD